MYFFTYTPCIARVDDKVGHYGAQTFWYSKNQYHKGTKKSRVDMGAHALPTCIPTNLIFSGGLIDMKGDDRLPVSDTEF